MKRPDATRGVSSFLRRFVMPISVLGLAQEVIDRLLTYDDPLSNPDDRNWKFISPGEFIGNGPTDSEDLRKV
jgi:hypothetical protein